MKENAVDGWSTVKFSVTYRPSAVKLPGRDEWLTRAAPRETRAYALSGEAKPILGTPVERYLRRVGVRPETLGCPDGRWSRSHPRCPKASVRRPTLRAMVLDPVTGAPCGIERGFLLPDGSDRLGDTTGNMSVGRGGCGALRGNVDADALWLAASVDAAVRVATTSRARLPHCIVAQGVGVERVTFPELAVR